jgi:hypothetical protein
MSIFISIASYRDPTLIKTIKSALDNARWPESIYFGLGLQYYEDEIPDLSFLPESKYITLNWHPEERPGLIKIRYLLSQLYGFQQYFLMIDSHMEFVKDWDTKIYAYMQQVEDKFGSKNNVLLVQSPMRIPDTDKIAVNDQKFHFEQLNSQGMNQNSTYHVSMRPVNNVKTDFEELEYTTTWRSGAVVMPGRFIREVGFDPYTHGIHEEGYLSFRSFLAGWNIYQVNVDMITHKPEEYYDAVWSNEKFKDIYTVPKFIDNQNTMRDFAMAFIYNDYSKYAVKNAVRSPEDYWAANDQKDFYWQMKALADKELYNL